MQSVKKMPSVGLVLAAVFALVLAGVVFFKYRLSNQNSAELNVWSRMSKVQSLEWPQGQQIDEAVRGKLVLVHFWATWCQPCEDELPEIIKFATEFPAEKPLIILAVSLDKTWDEAKKMIPSSLPARWINVLDPKHEFAEGLGAYQYPETLVVGLDGRVQVKWVGAQAWTSVSWRDEFTKWFERGMSGK